MKRTEVEVWLQQLLAQKHSLGKIHVANIHGSLLHDLVNGRDLENFLTDCVKTSDPDEAVRSFNNACTLVDGITTRYFGLKPVGSNAITRGERFTTVILASIFHEHLISQAPTGIHRAASWVAPVKPWQKEDFLALIPVLDGNGTWARPDAHIGRKRMGKVSEVCVWFTRQPEIEDALAGAGTTNPADLVRDLLGLIHRLPEEGLMMISFPAEVLLPATGIRVAQPTFADGGNLRFAAAQRGDRYTANRKSEWGTTVDLAKFAAQYADHTSDCCGMPERVANPVPVDASTFRLRYLGEIIEPRGTKGDHDLAFAEWLFADTPLPAIINSIVESVAI